MKQMEDKIRKQTRQDVLNGLHRNNAIPTLNEDSSSDDDDVEVAFLTDNELTSQDVQIDEKKWESMKVPLDEPKLTYQTSENSCLSPPIPDDTGVIVGDVCDTDDAIVNWDEFNDLFTDTKLDQALSPQVLSPTMGQAIDISMFG